ncbi:MAG: protease modulator HflC, partial [Verrucomicrobiales bacterium]
PEAADFYEFVRTMELYQSTLGGGTVVLSTDSDLFKYLKAVKPVGPSSSAEVAEEALPESITAPAAKAAPKPVPTVPAPAPQPASAPAGPAQ